MERDGAFVPDLEGAVGKARVDEVRATNATLAEQLADQKRRFEGIDPDEARRLAEESAVRGGEIEELIESRNRTADCGCGRLPNDSAVARPCVPWQGSGMRLPRWCRVTLAALAAIIAVVAIGVASVWIYLHPDVQRTNGLVYGQRHGRNLTLDVVRPARPNGVGVVLMVSGGWKSSAGSFRPWMAAALFRRGYTVFAVYHVSQPEATVMEITEDVNRAVRYVRHRAREYGVDPARLGVTGGSAGGHLSLMLATRGGPGAPSATDAIDSESSAVQAVAIFYPVTDLLNLGDSTENLHDGGPPKSFVRAFGPNSTNLAAWKVIGHEMSPIYYVTSNLPPTLIYHGDADTLVPMDQSERFQAEARKLGRTVELVVHHGGKHGWLSMVWDIRQFADWFDRYLRQRSN